jgi:hypothetical protein
MAYKERESEKNALSSTAYLWQASKLKICDLIFHNRIRVTHSVFYVSLIILSCSKLEQLIKKALEI